MIAVVEVEDLDWSKAELAELRSGKIVARSFDPCQPIRKKINAAVKQFSGATDYPCMLVLNDNKGTVLDHLFITAAMIGDLAITFPVSAAGEEVPEDRVGQGFGERGKMLPRSGILQNTRVSAIGVLRTIKPDVLKSGHREKLGEIAGNMKDTSAESFSEFSQSATQIERELTERGHDLERTATSVSYVKNPVARLPFPMELAGGQFDEVFEYGLGTGELRRLK